MKSIKINIIFQMLIFSKCFNEKIKKFLNKIYFKAKKKTNEQFRFSIQIQILILIDQ